MENRAQVNITEQVDPNEVRFAIQFFREALVKASKGYSPTPPDQARAAVRVALVGTIRLISAIYPDEPSLPLPLKQLLYDLGSRNSRAVCKDWELLKIENEERSENIKDRSMSQSCRMENFAENGSR
jgi:hypothetical protein